MTMADAKMSERLLDLEDIIRPIAIEETRRYLDSRNLVTKDYLKEQLNERLGVTEKLFKKDLELINQRIDGLSKDINTKLEYGLKDVKKSALIQTGFVLAGAISLIVSIVLAASSITAAIQANQAKPAVSQPEAPSTQTR